MRKKSLASKMVLVREDVAWSIAATLDLEMTR